MSAGIFSLVSNPGDQDQGSLRRARPCVSVVPSQKQGGCSSLRRFLSLAQETLNAKRPAMYRNGLLDRDCRPVSGPQGPKSRRWLFCHMVPSIQYEGPIGRCGPKEENILWGRVGGGAIMRVVTEILSGRRDQFSSVERLIAALAWERLRTNTSCCVVTLSGQAAEMLLLNVSSSWCRRTERTDNDSSNASLLAIFA